MLASRKPKGTTKPLANHAEHTPGSLDGKSRPKPNPEWQSLALRPAAIQAKLTVSQPGDPYEQEADQVAERVMRQPIPMVQRACATCSAGGSPCPECEAEQRVEVQRSAASTSTSDAAGVSVPESFVQNFGSGRPLDPTIQADMEYRFGHDFSHVRVHADGEAANAAGGVHARAYTIGRDIVFGSGDYAPTTAQGQRLLAHELAHVVQQADDTPTLGAPAAPRQEAKDAGAEIGSAPVSDGYAGRMSARADSDSGRSAAGQPKNGLVQRFASEEHQHLGDVATGTASYDLGKPGDKFELTHGDILALSGDVFMPDDLFKLAATPGNRGQKVGTRDEVLWALQDTRIWEMRGATSGLYAQKKDPRFQAGGPYAGYVFSDPVKDAVFDRYRKLGAANAGHFVAPQGRDAKGAPIPASDSAGGNYRKFHEVAIREADKAGRAGINIGVAMAREAAAQHFLTDEFSAGHLRTPAGAIRDYWGNKYPLFWYNLRHKIALDTAIEMTSGTLAPAYNGYTEILASVEAMAPKLPAVTLGDLLASVFHDFDNEKGLNLQGGGKVFGDTHLDAGTEKLAISAIKAGNKDIHKAYDIGKQMSKPVPDADLFAQVRLTSDGVGDKYAAETQVPEPSKSEPAQNWKASDINTLWGQPFLGKTGDTVGQEISKRVTSGSINVQLTSLAVNFPLTKPTRVGDLHPRAAYLQGFVRNLQADAKAGLLDIVNWAPHGMATGYAPREAVADLEAKGAAGDKKENLGNMTWEQRIEFIKGLISDGKDPDREAIIKIFASTLVVVRPLLYKAIEGHDWTGDLKRKLGSRDTLYKAMDNDARADRLRDAINGK